MELTIFEEIETEIYQLLRQIDNCHPYMIEWREINYAAAKKLYAMYKELGGKVNFEKNLSTARMVIDGHL